MNVNERINFSPEDHVYTCEGEVVPSVTQILRFCSKEVYGPVNEDVLKNAARRGTLVHESCEAIDKHGACFQDPEIENYLTAYYEFLIDHKPKWLGIEQLLFSEKNWYAGTADRIGKLDGTDETCLIDLKTTSAVKKQLVQPQLLAYKTAWEENNNSTIDKLMILHLRKDGTYKLIEFEQDDSVWNACLTLHKAFPKRKKRA